jgi:hypothetical protein
MQGLDRIRCRQVRPESSILGFHKSSRVGVTIRQDAGSALLEKGDLLIGRKFPENWVQGRHTPPRKSDMAGIKKAPPAFPAEGGAHLQG